MYYIKTLIAVSTLSTTSIKKRFFDYQLAFSLHHSLPVYINRKSTKVNCLGPGESCLYTWDHPLDKRILVWSAGMEADKQDELVKV